MKTKYVRIISCNASSWYKNSVDGIFQVYDRGPEDMYVVYRGDSRKKKWQIRGICSKDCEDVDTDLLSNPHIGSSFKSYVKELEANDPVFKKKLAKAREMVKRQIINKMSQLKVRLAKEKKKKEKWPTITQVCREARKDLEGILGKKKK